VSAAAALPTVRLTSAELLKLRKRRGLVVTATLLTVGITVFYYGLNAILHSANPAHHGPAGGIENLGHGLVILSLFGAIAAGIVGATAGAGDLGAGVFRELVVTGRSRWSLFLSRVPGGLAFLLPLVFVAFLVNAFGSTVFADTLPEPSLHLLVESGAWMFLDLTIFFVIGLGLASLIGSRTTTIAVLLAFRLVLTPLLLSISFLGVIRELVPGAAMQRLGPAAFGETIRQGPDVPMSVGAAIAVIVGWLVVALAAGGWRTATRDA
jgi:ABC-type transport system involved in multi-copper enzyme maturation permease subunit